MFIYRLIAHLRTILKHKRYVFCYCCKVGLYWQGIIHDNTKFSFSEFYPGVKYYTGKKSPNSIQKEIEGYSSAWLHHKSRNKHHYEYWMDYNEKCFKERGEKITPIEMPTKYLVEMFCDRVAACKTYKGKEYTDSDPLEYYEQQREQMIIHKKTRVELEKLLRDLAEHGEAEAFRYAREIIKNKKGIRKSKKV